MLHPEMPETLSPLPSALTAARPRAPLAGAVAVPGDKSISHRALMFGALAVGRTEITGLLEGEDVLATAAALRAMGAGIERAGNGRWLVDGVGVGGLGEPDDVLDLGNSGTSARLLLGILGDAPAHRLCHRRCARCGSRPMRRVIDPLSRFGARFVAREGGRLPLAVTGAADPVPVEYRLPVPSAQVKSAVLLAGLNTPGVTSVIENEPTRDHTERMLRHFGATVRVDSEPGGGRRISVEGQPELDGGADRRAGRPVLGRLSARRGAARAGVRHQDRECRAQPVAHRAARQPRRDGGRNRVREPRARRAASRSPIFGCGPGRSPGSTCRPSARRR